MRTKTLLEVPKPLLGLAWAAPFHGFVLRIKRFFKSSNFFERTIIFFCYEIGPHELFVMYAHFYCGHSCCCCSHKFLSVSTNSSKTIWKNNSYRHWHCTDWQPWPIGVFRPSWFLANVPSFMMTTDILPFTFAECHDTFKYNLFTTSWSWNTKSPSCFL